MVRFIAIMLVLVSFKINARASSIQSAFPQESPSGTTWNYTQTDKAAVPTLSVWPFFRHDLTRSGRSSFTGPDGASIAWNATLSGYTYSSPSIGPDGTVYVGSEDRIFAFSPEGSQIWSHPIDGYAISSPAIGQDGTIYVGSLDRHLYALRPDGSNKWLPLRTGGEVWSSPVIKEDGTLYFGSNDNRLYALESETGTILWHFDTRGEVVSSPAIGPDGTIYVGSLDSTLYAINPDGSKGWTFPTGDEIVSSPAIGPDFTIYFGSRDNKVYALDGETGREKWSFTTGGEVISSPALGSNGVVYIGSRDSVLYALSSQDGSPRWTYETSGEIISSPTIDANGRIYFGSLDGNVYALTPEGSLHWSLDLQKPVWSSVTISDDGTLFTTTAGDETTDGQLCAVASPTADVSFPEVPSAGEPTPLTVRNLTEPRPVSATLFFRRGGEREFVDASLTPTATSAVNFEGIIPGEYVGIRGIEYFIEFTDGESVWTYPSFHPRSSPAVQQVRIESAETPLPLNPWTYSMISVPLQLDDPQPSSFLLDDFGPYISSQWRLFRWQNEAYTEGPDFPDEALPGHAFFIVTNSGGLFDVENGWSVDTSQPFSIPLRPGWNQVGNPFAFPVSWQEIRETSQIDAVAFYDGTEVIQDPSRIRTLEPWQGYWVLNNSSHVRSMNVPPIESGINSGSASKISHDPAFPPEDGFVINLVARTRSDDLRDTQNWIGFLDEAETSYLAQNVIEAPPVGNYVRLSIVEEEERFAANFKSPSGGGSRWDLEIEALDARSGRGTRSVDVSLHRTGQIPDDYSVALYDRDYDRLITLENDLFSVELKDPFFVRHLSVLIGTEAYIQESSVQDESLPSSVVLEQNYPNPFNPSTIIRYQINERVPVRLEIYNVTGQKVRSLVDSEQQAPGWYEVIWDGKTDSGIPMASGSYFYRLTAGSFTETRMMTLIH